jgi:hypothetical protein
MLARAGNFFGSRDSSARCEIGVFFAQAFVKVS